MQIKSDCYTIGIDEKNGSLLSFCNANNEELLCQGIEPLPLFSLRLRNDEGEPFELSSVCSNGFEIKKGSGKTTLCYDLSETIKVTVTIETPEGSAFSYWQLSVENNSAMVLDHVDFPGIVVPNDLVATGGKGRIFWPAMEGVVVEDITLRQSNGFMQYRPIEYPNYQGWNGYYPAPCPMQFMAYFRGQSGLYLAAHDEQCNIKGIEFREYQDGIALDYRLFPGGTSNDYQMPYKMVLGVFEGDWHEAAEIYRNWIESSKMPLPDKLVDNKSLPQWFYDSPVVVIYPVRGTQDMEKNMPPNESYYPYTNALPYLEQLAEQMDSRVMALLMHWESTAPWAPPYAWPPYGDEDNFIEFVEGLHKNNHLAGVYCSGIGWTIESNLNAYSTKERYEKENLERIMTAAPGGKVQWSGICSGEHAQRWSYDMCPANEQVGEIVLEQIKSITEAGCDYIQYFDQNIGGACYFCYSSQHGHPPAPGKWMNEAMISMYEKLLSYIEESGRDIVLGCESAVSEPFMKYLPFNDLRFNVNLWIGRPVPACAYIFHEYINSFMGNQNMSSKAVVTDTSPLNLHQRTAYSFVAGDMFTVVLKDKGKFCWDWDGDWNSDGPDHDSVATLIKNLNDWRKKAAKEFLHFGRMLKPFALAGAVNIPMNLHNGSKQNFDSLFTSRWELASGQQCQIIVNYTGEPQDCDILLDGVSKVQIFNSPDVTKPETIPVSNNRASVTVAPLNAVMICF